MSLKKLVILFPFLIMGEISFTQTKSFDLEGLIEIVDSSNSDIQKQQLILKQWEIKKDKVYHLNDLQMGVQAGQNDGEEQDFFLSISQPIGSPWSIAGKKKYAQASIDYETALMFSLRKQMNYKVKIEYLKFQYHNHIVTAINSIENEIQKAYNQSQNLLESQSITTSEFIVLEQLFNHLIYLKQSHSRHKIEAKNSIAELLNLSDFQIKAESNFEKYSFKELSMDTVLLSPYQEQIKRTEAHNKLIKGKYSPELQLGYFNQSLQKEFGFQGVTVGVSVPLFYSQKKQELKINEIQKQVFNQDLITQKNKIENALKGCLEYFIQVDSSYFLKNNYDWELGIKELTQKKSVGEISQLEFVQYYEVILRGKLGELEHIYEYNQMVLKYKFLSQ